MTQDNSRPPAGRGDHRQRFAEALHALALTFRVEDSLALYDAYWMGLDDIELPALEKAVRRAMRECEYMPTVAVLRSLAGRPPPSKALPPYYDSERLAREMEALETCEWHRVHPREKRAEKVRWCRKCLRQDQQIAASTFGEMVDALESK